MSIFNSILVMQNNKDKKKNKSSLNLPQTMKQDDIDALQKLVEDPNFVTFLSLIQEYRNQPEKELTIRINPYSSVTKKEILIHKAQSVLKEIMVNLPRL